MDQTAETPTSPNQQEASAGKVENIGVAQLAALLAASRSPGATAPAEEQQGEEVPNPAEPETESTPEEETESGAEEASDTAETEDGSDEVNEQEPATEAEDAEPKGAVKRIHKLTAKLKSQSEELERTKAELEQLKGRKDNPAPEVVADVSEMPEVADLDRQIQTYRHLQRWCRENPDGGEFKVGGVSYGQVDAVRAEELLRESETQITRLTARRETRAELAQERIQAERVEWGRKSNEAFPWLKSQSGPEYTKAMEVLGGFTKAQQNALLANPRGLYLLGAAVKGLQAVEIPKTAQTPRKAPPKVPAKPAGAAPKSSSPKAQLEEQLRQAQERFASSGRGNDFARVESLKLALRKAA